MILLLISTVVRHTHQEEINTLTTKEWIHSRSEEQRILQQEKTMLSTIHDAGIDGARSLSALFDKNDEAVARVVGGNPITTQQYPFFVQADTEESKEYCGGSLVASDVVLTSAQCQSTQRNLVTAQVVVIIVLAYELTSLSLSLSLSRFLLSDAFKSTRVLVGPYNRDSLDGPAEYRSIIGDLVPHPAFDKATNKNDYMLFKIEAVTLTNLKPIVLNTNASVPLVGLPITVLGMGQTGTTANVSSILRSAVIQSLAHTVCQTAYTGVQDIDETTMLCGTSTGRDSCLGE